MSEEPEVWCILIVNNGQVSLLKGLTEDECRGALQRLPGAEDPWSDKEIYSQLLAGRGLSGPSLANIGNALAQYNHSREPERVEWWGSRNSTLEVWPKPADYDQRFDDAKRIAELIEDTNADVSKARATA